MAAQHLGDLLRPQRGEERGQLVRRYEVVGQPAQQRVPGPTTAPVRARWVPSSPGARASRYVPPTSGTKPIPVSGMATFDRSVTIRTLPCAETPTPPPITMPSMTATYGFG